MVVVERNLSAESDREETLVYWALMLLRQNVLGMTFEHVNARPDVSPAVKHSNVNVLPYKMSLFVTH